MLKDRYDCPLTTTSHQTRDGYVAALDLMLEGQAGIQAGFEAVTQSDPEFALGWAGLARAHQYGGDMVAAQAAIRQARACATVATEREISQISVLELMLQGKMAAALSAVYAHLQQYPRDAMIAQTSSSIFGLIGFSGQSGREAEMLAFNARLLPHYGDDWWAISQYAFALCETGNLREADRQIDHAMALNPRNAHGAHVRAHVSYELGETATGRAFLRDWLSGYDRAGVMFTHLNWHDALWALAQGDIAAMWARIDDAVAPEAEAGAPPINTLTDTVSILHRAVLAGVEVAPDRWTSVSDFALRAFPKTGNAFIDIHAALAHAMAGRRDALEAIISHPAGPAADLVPDLARGLAAAATRDWPLVHKHMLRAMSDHARVGGSRAQRDLIELTLLTALAQTGEGDTARDIALLRRPVIAEQLTARV